MWYWGVLPEAGLVEGGCVGVGWRERGGDAAGNARPSLCAELCSTAKFPLPEPASTGMGPDFSVAPTSRIPTGPRDARHIPTATEGRAAYPYGYSFGPVRCGFLRLRRKIYGLTGAAGENFAVSTACISYCSCKFRHPGPDIPTATPRAPPYPYGYACPPDVSLQ